eukprot:15146514-Alexandrium_andersonii.AAC.1
MDRFKPACVLLPWSSAPPRPCSAPPPPPLPASVLVLSVPGSATPLPLPVSAPLKRSIGDETNMHQSSEHRVCASGLASGSPSRRTHVQAQART